MNEEQQARLGQLRRQIEDMYQYLDLQTKQKSLQALEKQMSQPGFWEDKLVAQKVIAESKEIKSWVDPFLDAKTSLENLEDIFPEAVAIEDLALIEELMGELEFLEKRVDQLEVRRMFTSEMDSKNCFLSINAGAGGTESCDWVQMLMRMYQRWAASRSWNVEVVDLIAGDVAGVKNVMLKLSGNFSYGYSKAERGVHRLVRISPFDSNAKRHTSFAAVEVTPEITDDIEIELREEDMRIDTYRASGAGGQHVNKTDSAVRITHIPTQIVVSCQSERSQHQNKDICIKLLKSKLYQEQVMQREKELKKMAGDKMENAWGSQIRNYVFQPYTLVKDTRTGYEVGNIQAMMDGDLLDNFIETYLKQCG